MIRSILSKKWGSLLAWQICALDLCAIGTICSYMTLKYGQTITFLMLTGAYILMFAFSAPKCPKSDIPWSYSFLLTLTSILGDYLCVLAYEKTSLSSALLLQTTVVIFVVPISFVVFKRRYSWVQILAILIGFLGIVFIIVADGIGDTRLLGNFLALIGSVCYAVSTVTQEKLVTEISLDVYIFRFSSIASPIGLGLTAALEIPIISHFNWEAGSILLILAYSILLALYDIMSPMIMEFSTANEMNLSMLTSNFYTLLVSIFLFNRKFSVLYIIGFLCIPSAIVLYSVGEKPQIFHSISDTFLI